MHKEKSLHLKGRVWVIPIPDIDTDMIFHNRYLHIIDPNEAARYIFGNLPGWERFPSQVERGDILIVGPNFGCGSSRQQAVDGLIALGVAAIVGESFGAIFKRNAINAGLAILECPNILLSPINNGDVIEVDLERGLITHPEGQFTLQARPMSEVQKEIYLSGGLFALASKN